MGTAMQGDNKGAIALSLFCHLNYIVCIWYTNNCKCQKK